MAENSTRPLLSFARDPFYKDNLVQGWKLLSGGQLVTRVAAESEEAGPASDLPILLLLLLLLLLRRKLTNITHSGCTSLCNTTPLLMRANAKTRINTHRSHFRQTHYTNHWGRSQTNFICTVHIFVSDVVKTDKINWHFFSILKVFSLASLMWRFMLDVILSGFWNLPILPRIMSFGQ